MQCWWKFTIDTDYSRFNDIRAANMTVCWHHLPFQFSNFEFLNLAIYFDVTNLQIQIIIIYHFRQIKENM
jgi:hypothetical protein